MQNFPEHNLENMGGISSFNFIPTYSISEMPFIYNNTIENAVTLNAGATWKTGITKMLKNGFEEDTKDTDAGLLYTYKINGLYPGQSVEMSNLCDEMARVPLVIDVIDNNGNRRLIGTKDAGAKFLFSFKTKDTPSGRPEYSYQFIWESDKMAPYYNI